MKHLRLVDDARHAWRFASLRAAALLALLAMVQADVLPLLQPLLSPKAFAWTVMGLAAAIGVLRLLKQQLPGVSAGEDHQDKAGAP